MTDRDWTELRWLLVTIWLCFMVYAVMVGRAFRRDLWDIAGAIREARPERVVVVPGVPDTSFTRGQSIYLSPLDADTTFAEEFYLGPRPSMERDVRP